MERLAAQHPNADTELHFTTPYELLVATILSAQCTDERVNQVTPALFARYPDARALARASMAELEPQIQSTGFFRAKSRSLVGMASALVERHRGEVPDTLDALVDLPGVGRKTANVVLGHALGVPGLPVDRHVLRVSNRIGIARSEDPEIVEQQLCAVMPPERWTVTSDTLILHGRRICKPRPLCDRCAVRNDCEYYRTALGTVGRPPSRSPARGRTHPRSASDSAALFEGHRAAKVRGTAGGGDAARKAAESASSELRRATKVRGTPGDTGRTTKVRGTDEHGPSPEGRRAPRERGPGGGAGPTRDADENGPSSEGRRAPRERGPGGGAGPTRDADENGLSSEKRRAPKVRGTGRGGGAPRQTKK
jgi:endonuclease III